MSIASPPCRSCAVWASASSISTAWTFSKEFQPASLSSASAARRREAGFRRPRAVPVAAKAVHREAAQEHRGPVRAASLEDLTLRAIATKDLATLRRSSASAISTSSSAASPISRPLKARRASGPWRSGRSAASAISGGVQLTGLQHLHLQSLPHVKTLPDLRRLTKLRRVYLENMQGLESLRSLARAPALEEVIHVSASLSPEDHAALFDNPAIKRISAGFGSIRKKPGLRSHAARTRHRHRGRQVRLCLMPRAG